MNKYVYWILFICLHHAYAVGPGPHSYPELQGPFCAKRTPTKCCSGRRDDCSAPIMNTLCYCDDFCNRTRNEDCCPDYWSVCKGISPIVQPVTFIKKCKHQGLEYEEGTVVKINCRQCECKSIQPDYNRAELLCDNSVKCLIEEDDVDRINRNNGYYGWTAYNYTTFWGRRYEEGLLSRLGTIKSSNKQIMEMSPINQIFDPKEIPRNFDARQKWENIISRPRDQGWCGSSWIFSTVSVASDRFAIMTYGNDQTFLSPQQLLDCIRTQPGCQGGHLTRAWTFIRKFGLVPDSCYPWEGRQSECGVKRMKKRLETVCPNDRQKELAVLHRVGPVYRIATEAGIVNEIMHSGPVQATMTVTRDFFSYKSGIYKCGNLISDDRTGYHSVRIIGWDEEVQNGQLKKYWIVSNSWGEWWGENGYFRILRGVNECGIEDFVIAVWANIEDLKISSKTIRQAQYSNNIKKRR